MNVQYDKTMPYNEGHALEGADRCHTILVMIDQLLASHPAVLKAGVVAEIEEATEAIATAYQKIGLLMASEV